MSNGLWSTIVDNAVFVVEVVLIAAVLVAVAYLAERFAKKKNGDTERVLSTRKLAMIENDFARKRIAVGLQATGMKADYNIPGADRLAGDERFLFN